MKFSPKAPRIPAADPKTTARADASKPAKKPEKLKPRSYSYLQVEAGGSSQRRSGKVRGSAFLWRLEEGGGGGDIRCGAAGAGESSRKSERETLRAPFLSRQTPSEALV